MKHLHPYAFSATTLTIALLTGLILTPPVPPIGSARDTVTCRTAGPVKVCWSFAGDRLTFTVRAPATGWVALGINDSPELSGTRLFVSARTGAGHSYLSERHIVGPGHHLPVVDVGLAEWATGYRIRECSTATEFTLYLPGTAGPRSPSLLSPGRSVYLLLAYSESDDLAHHSRFRRTIRVKL